MMPARLVSVELHPPGIAPKKSKTFYDFYFREGRLSKGKEG